MPMFNVVKIDETQYFTNPTGLNIKTYWTVYIFDSEEETYCCELTPSHWLEAVGYDIEPIDHDIDPWISDDLHDDLMRDLHYSSHYRHVRGLKDSKEFGEFDDLEDAIECYRANPWYC